MRHSVSRRHFGSEQHTPGAPDRDPFAYRLTEDGSGNLKVRLLHPRHSKSGYGQAWADSEEVGPGWGSSSVPTAATKSCQARQSALNLSCPAGVSS
jgi:hypothetical protein